MGEQPDFTTLCAYTTNENIEFQIEKIINDLEGFEILIVTDVFGGSVNNCFMKYIEKDNIHLITGLNLPLLMEIVCNKYLPVEEMIEKAGLGVVMAQSTPVVVNVANEVTASNNDEGVAKILQKYYENINF